MKTECLQKGVQCTVCQDHFREFFCLILWNSGSVAMTTICTKPLEKKIKKITWDARYFDVATQRGDSYPIGGGMNLALLIVLRL